MASKLWVLLLLASGLAACDRNIQQALAPDPRLLPSSPPASPLASPIVTATPELTSPSSSPVTAAVPNQLVDDLAKLQVLTAAEASLPAGTVVTRKDYARWLFAAHNAIYHTQDSQKIKLANADTQPVFTDVPTTHPDFPIIQGLADAGIIPSALSGSTTDGTFGGELPLTREQLIAWKVPLDRRQAVPTASVSQVQQTWGFQDTAKITPTALGAILADYQSGDRANIRRAFGYTTILQPQKPVTFAEVVSTIWYFGAREGQSASDALQASPPPS